ncbi:MAG TPA: hypothetical protein VHE35_09455 [Kofleriaceae bacterium]|nr:hypothetical protein [Kofleriaceae bacterium]
MVLAADRAVARWAATPITGLQPGSPFVPIVIGADRVPRVSVDRARREPWLAVLSVLAHGPRADGRESITAVAAALEVLPAAMAAVCYDAIWRLLDEIGQRILEDEMLPDNYEFKSPLGRRYAEVRDAGRREGLAEGEAKGLAEGEAKGLAEGEAKGLAEGEARGLLQGRIEAARAIVLALLDGRGAAVASLVARVEACDSPEALRAAAVAIARATDVAGIERALAELSAPPAR